MIQKEGEERERGKERLEKRERENSLKSKKTFPSPSPFFPVSFFPRFSFLLQTYHTHFLLEVKKNAESPPPPFPFINENEPNARQNELFIHSSCSSPKANQNHGVERDRDDLSFVPFPLLLRTSLLFFERWCQSLGFLSANRTEKKEGCGGRGGRDKTAKEKTRGSFSSFYRRHALLRTESQFFPLARFVS